MEKNSINVARQWILVSVALCLCLLGSLVSPSISIADDPDALCVLNVVAEGNVLSILVNQPQNFSIAMVLPIGKDVSAPVPCSIVGTLGAAVANQTNTNVNVAMQILDHDGAVICSKGPFVVTVNGGRGFTFSDCQ